MFRAVKYINLLSQTGSYLGSRISGSHVQWGMPFSVGLELTNYCNLSCVHCASGSGESRRAKGYMSIDLFNKIKKELSPYIITTMFYFQGESMMHPQFFELLESAENMGPLISTNGHFLDEKSCKLLAGVKHAKIIVSIDGITEDSYRAYRVGGNIRQVKEGIETLSAELQERGQKRRMGLQVLVNRYNEGELGKLSEYAKNLGIRIKFKSMQLIGDDGNIDFLPEDPKYRRYINESGRLNIKSNKENHCFRLWTNPVITWDGKVLPCCFDKDADYIMGDINELSFREIWNGSKYKEFRARLLNNRAGIDICNNCSEGLLKEVKV